MNLATDTSLALMQATQSQVSDVAKNAMAKTKGVNDGKIDEKQLENFDIKVDTTFGGGKGEEIFQGMMLQEYGKMMAETGQLGIADSVRQELIRMQSESDNGAVR